MGREMRQNFGTRQAMHEDMRTGMEGLIAGLKAVPFDADAVAGYMAGHRVDFNARLELGQTLLLQRLTKMDDAERAAYADRLLMVMQQGRHKRKPRE